MFGTLTTAFLEGLLLFGFGYAPMKAHGGGSHPATVLSAFITL